VTAMLRAVSSSKSSVNMVCSVFKCIASPYSLLQASSRLTA
jgi:hypothetical protein